MDNPQLLPSDAADLAANRAGRMSDRQRAGIATVEAHRLALYRRVSAFLPGGIAAHMRMVREDTAAGAVTACDAVVEFAHTTPDGARNTYTARALATGAPLHLWSFTPPGARRLYVLPRSGLVVGSEPPDAGALGAYRDLLLGLQRVSAADLTTLARGSVPSACIAMLRAGRNEGAFAVVAFGTAILGAMLAILGIVPGLAASPVALLVAGLATAVVGGALGTWLLARRARIPALVRVEAHEGLLATRTLFSDAAHEAGDSAARPATSSFYLRVGPDCFQADHFEFMGAFVPGLPHRIWITQPGATAIVVEPLV